MKSAAVIPSLKAGDVVNTCIKSMIDGGYDGDIYVVSQDEKNIRVTDLGDNVRFVHTRVNNFESVDTLIYKGFLAFDKKYDVMIYSHSDVTFLSGWWQPVKDLWDSVDRTRVWNINVPMSNECIVVTDPQQKLGLGFDKWNPGCHGRISPVSSFLCDFYAAGVNKYGGDTSYFAMEHFLYYEAIVQHKWQLMANIGSGFVHDSPKSDTSIMEKEQPGLFHSLVGKAYESWFGYFGYNLEHFITTWFGNVMTRHTTEIVTCVNAGNYEALDYIFNEGIEMLKLSDCDTCSFKCPAMDKIHLDFIN